MLVSDFANLGGWVDDQKEVESTMNDLPFPVFQDIWGPIKGSGKNKVQLLHNIVEKVAGYFPNRHQVIGDCQNPSARVRMADGSEKMIKDVKVGDYVISAYGNIKRVISILKKPYSGNMIKIKVNGWRDSIESTPDHLYLTIPDLTKIDHLEWKKIEELSTEDFVLISKLPNLKKDLVYDLNDFYDHCITDDMDFHSLRIIPVDLGKIRVKNGKTSNVCNRFITLNEKLAWLLGIYAAEGGCDGNYGDIHRITFNLGSHETSIAEKIRSYIIDVFDFEPQILKIKSKPSCLFVRINNKLIAKLFKYLCSGNVYNKKFNKDILLLDEPLKIELLRGWLDGDGHMYKRSLNFTGVSSSFDLVRDLYCIANSCGLGCKIRYRKAYKQSKESFSLNFNRKSSAVLNTYTKSNDRSSINSSRYLSTKYGMAARIISKDIVNPESEYVYCIGVEEDHSFICNGYGIHNCVSMMGAYQVDVTKCVDIFIKKDLEEWINETSTEDLYWGSRVLIGKGRLGNQDGSIGAWLSQYVNQYGALPRGNYGEIDTTIYSGQKARSWGRPNTTLPKSFVDKIKQHPIEVTSRVDTYEQVVDLIYNGYPVGVCSNQGFHNVRDSEGFASPKGTWMHAMTIIAVDDSYRRKGCLIQNSWGKWNSGPKRHNQPDGSFWVDADVINRMLAQRDSWAYGSYVGFQPQKLNTRII